MTHPTLVERLRALVDWLSTVSHSDVRQLETQYQSGRRRDARALRGVLVADDLLIDRRLQFWRMNGAYAEPVERSVVAKLYDVTDLRMRYERARQQRAQARSA